VSADWDLLTRIFLHDPPDKALDIRGHEGRAERYLAVALGRDVDAAAIKADAGLADTLAAIAERLPAPTAGAEGERAVSVENGSLQVCHPLGAGTRQIATPALNEAAVKGAIGSIVEGIDKARSRFLALWRLLPERLAEIDPPYAVLPADTRIPDHTIWHHADTAAALLPANSGEGAAFLSFAIAPVQSFIEAARSLRDLWSGSLILSWLSFRALLPIVEEVGPQALIFPYLRGTPLLDRWLHRQPGLAAGVNDPERDICGRPSLPNRFLALVPAREAAELARRCEGAAQTAWHALADKVREWLNGKVGEFAGWDALWQKQIDEFWDIRSSVLPYRSISDDALAAFSGARTFGEAWPHADKIRRLADCIPPAERPGYDQKHAGRWQATLDLAARALEARRSIRHVPTNAVPINGEVAEKCALLGTVERMGPANRARNREFWDTLSPSRDGGREAIELQGVRLRPREYFSAVALTKRFAIPAHLAHELGLGRHHRFPDTATVAARPWLERAHLAWREDANGQWLYWRKADQDENENPAPPQLWNSIRDARETIGWPPAYLAVLVMDGDYMGRWLRGEKNQAIGEVLHPKLRDYFATKGAGKTLQQARRPVGPALHAAISEALTNFATYIVPGIVEKHQGELIYAGGDDVLALLPTETAIACAAALREAFTTQGGYWRENGGRDLLVMGRRATVSAGIAIVHHKEDLRFALGLARRAERAAKQQGRNRLHLFIARRSGEHAGETLGWDECLEMTEAVKKFVAGASDRWAYRMRALVASLPPAAFDLEMKRQLARSDDETRSALQGMVERRVFCADGRASESVVRLWQAASFLARSREKGGED
jgi:CRISPR-associated protein Cmr2